MTVNDALRLIAGIVVLVSVSLAVTIHINWLYLTAFVGLNLLQSAFTKWCPMMTILRKAGLKDEGVSCS
ncbi:YgaP family membrane protein [Aurantivibrio plasticivorans]